MLHFETVIWFSHAPHIEHILLVEVLSNFFFSPKHIPRFNLDGLRSKYALNTREMNLPYHCSVMLLFFYAALIQSNSYVMLLFLYAALIQSNSPCNVTIPLCSTDSK